MKIIDFNGSKVNGCFVFCAGNCEISVSTMFKVNNPEIAIFDKDSGKLLKDNVGDIRSAISWVDNYGARD